MKELCIARRADFYKVIVKVIAITCALIFSSFAQANLNSFSYEGRLFDNAGNPLNSANVSMRVEIYSATGGCLLYQESHPSLNLSSAIVHEQGVFSLKVGTGTRGGADPGLNFADIFKNSNPLVGASSCNYTPAATDIRHLRVHVDSGGGYEVLSPDFDILSAPGTMVAQSLQGKAANEFLQVAGTVNQANLAALVGGGDASALHHHDSRYVQIGSAAAQNLGSGTLYTTGQVGIGTNAPTAGVELHVRDTAAVATVKIEGAAASGSKIVFNDAAVERAAINTEGGTSSLVISTDGTTAIRVDSEQNMTLTGSMLMGGILRVGQMPSLAIETAISTDLASTCGAGCSGGTWYRSDTGQYRIWDNTRGTRTFAVYEGAPNTSDVMQWDGARWVPAPMTMVDATKLPLAGGTITGSLTVAGSIAAASIGSGPIAATSLTSNSISVGTVVANNITVSIAPASALDVVNKNYSDNRLASRTIAIPIAGNDGQSIRWNNATNAWDYFNSLATGNTATLVTANNAVPNCLSTEKLQMSAGPFYTYTCVTDNSTDPTKLPLVGGTITGALTVSGPFAAQAAVNVNQIDANSMTISLSPAGNLNATNRVYVDTHVGSRSIAALPTVAQDGQSLRWNNTTSTWEYFTAGAAGVGVLSFNSRVGTVNPQANDYTWAQIDKTTSSLADLNTRSAADLNSGTLADARLSSNVARRDVANTFATGNHQINTGAVTNKGLTVQGFAGQTALLTEWQNSSSVTLYGINPSGNPTAATDLTNKAYVDGKSVAGDVVGAVGAVTVTRIQGVNVQPIAPTDQQFLRYNSAQSRWEPSSVVLANSIGSLGGLTNATQNFATLTDGSGTFVTPSYVSASGTHTLVMPMANAVGVNAGLISKADFDVFNNKQPALGFVPLNRAGGSMTGGLTLSADPTAALGAATKQYVDATNSNSIQTLGGLTATTQTLAASTASGLTPGWISTGSSHTLQIPMANVASVSAGLISKTEYDTFNNKQNALGFTPLNRSGDTMTGGLTLSADPTAALAAATKQYVDAVSSSVAANYLRYDGTVSMTDDLDLGGFKVINLATPTIATDGANKSYVDGLISGMVSLVGGSGSITVTGTASHPLISVRFGTVGGTALEGNLTLSGDVLGTVGALSVTGLRGIPLASTAPTSGEYLMYSGGAWRPGGIALTTGIVGSAEIANETVQSQDILDGTISNADISSGAAISLSKISGYGSMCTQNQSSVTITGGGFSGISSMQMASNAGGDIVLISNSAAVGGGIYINSTGPTADSYLDLRDGSGAVGSVRMATGVLKVFNQATGASNFLELGAGGSSPMTRIQLNPTVNQVSFGGASMTGINQMAVAGNLTLAGTAQLISGGTAAAPALRLGASGNSGLYSPAVNDVALSTSGTSRLYVAANGGVAVNASGTPTSDFFEVNGGTAGGPMAGRNITMTAESAGGTNFNGGNIVLNPGLGTGCGINGRIQIFGQTNLNGPVVLSTGTAGFSAAGGPCTAGNTCLTHTNSSSIIRLTTNFSGSLSCITQGNTDGQVLYVYLTNTVGSMTFTNNFSCSGGYSRMLFNTTPGTLGAGAFKHLQFIYDGPSTAWRLISYQ